MVFFLKELIAYEQMWLHTRLEKLSHYVTSSGRHLLLFAIALHSCDTYQIPPLIRGSSWSPEPLVVYCLCPFFFSPVFFLLFFVLCFLPFFCMHIVTYLCSLCLGWCQFLLQVWDHCMLCKLAKNVISFYSNFIHQFPHLITSFPSYVWPPSSVPLHSSLDC